MRTKRECEKAVRTTISMPPELWKLAVSRQRENQFAAFSDYIQGLIRRDQGTLQPVEAYVR